MYGTWDDWCLAYIVSIDLIILKESTMLSLEFIVNPVIFLCEKEPLVLSLVVVLRDGSDAGSPPDMGVVTFDISGSYI